MNALCPGKGSASDSPLHTGQRTPTASFHRLSFYLLGVAGTRLGSGPQENEPHMVPSFGKQMVQED